MWRALRVKTPNIDTSKSEYTNISALYENFSIFNFPRKIELDR